jgi:hypothetical protein
MTERDNKKMDFKVGDWITLIDDYPWEPNYPVEILELTGKNSYHTLVSSRGIDIIINTNFFRLATEAEIKKEKIRNIF